MDDSTAGVSVGALGSRSALVVGGSSGLGRAVALALAREGAKVMATGRSNPALLELRAIAKARGLAVRTLRSDARERGQVRTVMRRTGSLLGGPDLLVHAVGDYWEGPISRLTADRWEDLLRSNVSSALYSMQEALPGMRKRRFGRILLFGVAGGDFPRAARWAQAYRAAKVSLFALARSIAQEEAPNGITVNMILPGVIRGSAGNKASASVVKRIPARRLGTPQEIARAALFLLAEESGYITGSALTISGGLLL